MKWYKKLYKIVESCYLCIRFPFLYPRNRFTGKHRAYLLGNLRSKLYNDSIVEISITGNLEQDENTLFGYNIMRKNAYAILWEKDKKLVLSNDTDFKEIDLSKIIYNIDKFKILGISAWDSWNNNFGIRIHVKTIDETDTTNYGFAYHRVELIKNEFKYYLYKICRWVDEEILDRIFFIPTYTELDAMEPGWRKAFGIQMCEEIKQALKKHNYLYKYRITQIKEKFGTLRWYDEGAPKEVHDIIDKYENLSWNTCCCCGKPATKITSGWISPYCDDCFPKNNFASQIKINNVWEYAKD